MNLKPHFSLCAATGLVLVMSGCGGSGGTASINQAVLPQQYVLSTFPLPAQEVAVIAVTDDETIKMRVRDNMFFRWTPTEERVLEYTSSEYPDADAVDVDGRVAFHDGANNAFVIVNGQATPITDADGAQVKGTVFGFVDGKPLVDRGDGTVWSMRTGVVTLEKPTSTGTVRVEPKSVNPEGRIAGNVYRGSNSGPLQGYSAAFWDTTGRLREVGTLDSGQSQSRLACVFADGTAVGTIEGTASNALARWDWNGIDEVISQSTNFAFVDGFSSNGFVVGNCGGITDVTYIWTAASGIRSLADMTTGFPADAKSHRIYYPKVSPSGIIAGLLDVSDLNNPNAAPVWRGVILRPAN